MKIGVLALERQPSKKVARQVKISRGDCKQRDILLNTPEGWLARSKQPKISSSESKGHPFSGRRTDKFIKAW